MAPGSFRFDRFVLDPHDRQLRRDDAPVELNSRYLDALALLVREEGRLVSKTRFLDEVWRGVPVTDEALTQCIRTLRRQLGDDAGRPRFIETVPKHGYRFIASVSRGDGDAAVPTPASGAPTAAGPMRAEAPAPVWLLLIAAAGAAGGGLAGALGGLAYGLIAASPSEPAAMGTTSVLLVLICLTAVVGLLGGGAVAFGMAAAGYAVSGRFGPRSILGGAVGGLMVGGLVKLVGVDAFNLLFGRSPGEITGALEGALLGGFIGAGAWLGGRGRALPPLRRSAIATALAAGLAGLVIALLGGRLLAGSLDLVARRFPDSRLRLQAIGGLFGEDGLGPVSLAVSGFAEGLLFGACVVGAMILARRRWGAALAKP